MQPTRAAVSDFIGTLSPSQIMTVEALLQYSNGSYLFKNNDFCSAIQPLRIALKYSLFNIKIKAFFMLMMCYLRKYTTLRGPNH
jgi:hypothetical protein